MDNLPRVINFSGGKTSAMMTILHYRPGDIVLFQDTGREHPKTYKFIMDFEAHEGIPVTKIRYAGPGKVERFEQFTEQAVTPFDFLLSAKRYKVIPNRMKRICTVEMKIKTAKRYLRSIGIRKFENLIGFRADEQKRVLRRRQDSKSVKDMFPLYDASISKRDVEAFWQNKSYTLELPRILGNCVICPIKGKQNVMAILREHPEYADPYIRDEELSEQLNGKGNGRTYFHGVTIRQLRDLAQQNLFNQPLDALQPAFDCECGP